MITFPLSYLIQGVPCSDRIISRVCQDITHSISLGRVITNAKVFFFEQNWAFGPAFAERLNLTFSFLLTAVVVQAGLFVHR